MKHKFGMNVDKGGEVVTHSIPYPRAELVKFSQNICEEDIVWIDFETPEIGMIEGKYRVYILENS